MKDSEEAVVEGIEVTSTSPIVTRSPATQRVKTWKGCCNFLVQNRFQSKQKVNL